MKLEVKKLDLFFFTEVYRIEIAQSFYKNFDVAILR